MSDTRFVPLENGERIAQGPEVYSVFRSTVPSQTRHGAFRDQALLLEGAQVVPPRADNHGPS